MYGTSPQDERRPSEKNVRPTLRQRKLLQEEPQKINLSDRQKAYTNAFIRYGEKAQLIVAIEELSELQKELCKHLRNGDLSNMDAIIDETADVQIMLEQIQMIFGIDDCVSKRMEYKINRLEQRLKG